jgi:hypothetical protein
MAAKLSKAQLRAIEQAKKDIAGARAYDNYMEYAAAKYHRDVEYIKAHWDYYEGLKEYWERYRVGDVLCSAGKNTIEALCRLGIFSAPEYSWHRTQGVLDWVHYNEDWEA